MFYHGFVCSDRNICESVSLSRLARGEGDSGGGSAAELCGGGPLQHEPRRQPLLVR